MRFVYLFLFSKPFISLLPFFSTLTFGSFTSSFRFEPFISLYFFPLVSSLTSASFTSSFLTRPFHRVRPFVATLRFDSLLTSFPFVSTLRSCSLYLVPFVLNSSLPLVTFLPSFQRFHPVHCRLPFFSFHGVHFVTSLPFVSMCSSNSFTSSFRFKPLISLPTMRRTKHAAGLLECKGIRRLCEAQPRAQC